MKASPLIRLMPQNHINAAKSTIATKSTNAIQSNLIQSTNAIQSSNTVNLNAWPYNVATGFLALCRGLE